MKVYRILCYESDDQDWLDFQIDHSIHGKKELPQGSISAATIDPDDKISIEIARNKLSELEAKLNKESE